MEARAQVSEALLELTNLVIVGAVPDLRGAMAALADTTPDVVVTDCDLPDGDCYDVIDAARLRDPRPAVVVFPVHDDPSRGRRCLAAGADLYLPRSAGLRGLQDGVLDVTAGRHGVRRMVVDDRFRLIGRLAAGVAHDLNNYLAVIDMSLAMLHRRAEQPLLRAELAQAREAMEGATELTGALLQYARGGAPAPTQVDLGEMVRRVLDRFGRVIPPSVVVTVETDDPLPLVRGVATELEQLVLNLIVNASEAMPDGGELRLSVRRHDLGTVRLEVADTGAGLDAHLLAGGPVARSAKGGSGLGLGIVRSVVDRHGATLRIVPRAGGGTRVGVVFAPVVC